MRRNLAPVLALAAGLSACKAKVDGSNEAAAFRKGERQVGIGGRVSAPVTGEPAPATPTSYLLSSEDALSLTPLFEAYRAPAEAEPAGNYTQNFEAYRRFTESFLNRALALKALTPGRRVSVHIADDQQVNAFAGPFQDVVINAGTIAAADGTQLLAVLCHELGHSARNHSLKTGAYEASPANVDDVNRFFEAREAYLKTSYDAASQTYTHDAAGFQAVNKLWRVIAPRLDLFGKHEESEADVVGAGICGQLGMPVDTYVTALTGFLATGDATDAANAGDGAKTIDQIVGGDRFQLDKDTLSSFLFPSDSHPRNDERKDQLLRLKSVLASHYDAAEPLFNEWRTSYQGARGMGLTGLSLAEAVEHNIVTVRTEQGAVIKIRRPHLCGKRP